MQGTGGVRKVRVAVGGRGKSGGARVIYYFHGSESLPILIFAVFTKKTKKRTYRTRTEHPRQAHAGDQSAREVAKQTKGTTAWRARRFELSKLG